MGRKYLIRSQEEPYFVTFTVVGWIDIFTRDEYKDIFLDSVKYYQAHKGLIIYAWCIMTNHIHMILGSEGVYDLTATIRNLKSFSGRKIREAIEQNPYESRRDWIVSYLRLAANKTADAKEFQFWQRYSHPIELNTIKITHQRLDYLHENPVKAGFVEDPSHWLYSSARDYEQEVKGMLEIECLI